MILDKINVVKKIPPFGIPDEPIISSTQEFIPLLDVERNLAIFKNGGAAMVLETTSLNFGLLSEQEQIAVIASYAAFINSLSFTVQILVRTKKKDVSSYITYLNAAAPKIQNAKLYSLMQSYTKFITETIKKRNVLEKNFYIIIPFSPFELGISKSTFSSIFKKSKTLPFEKDYIIKKAEIALFPKRDHLIRQMTRLGLKLRQLTNEEIVKFYWQCMNPDAEVLRLRDQSQ